ncbi:MAG: gliding motility-associated C-terminal domain-containing protein [Bacteroidota bacterium]
MVFTATDACGLSSTAAATYIVLDTVAPLIDPATVTDVTLECNGNPSDPITQILTWSDGINAVDNCGPLSWSNDFVVLAGGCGGSTGTAAVTYTAEDECGLVSTIGINFTVEDHTPPNIDVPPADTTVACDSLGGGAAIRPWLEGFAGAVASDVCTPDNLLTAVWQWGGVDRSLTEIQDSLARFALHNCEGTIGIDFAFTDACGNTAIAPANFIITDLRPPVWDTDPQDLTLECDGSADPAGAIATWLAANGNAVASDACGGVQLTHDFTGLSDECGATGTADVTFTAEDDCGNTSTRMASVRIIDTTPPTWDTDPQPLSIECDGTTDPGGAIAAWLAARGNGSASDLCGNNITYTHDFTGLSDGCGATGMAVVNFTATDECGLSAQRTAEVRIVDTTPPVWTDAPDNLTLSCDGTNGPDLAIADWLNNHGNGAATDVCTGGVSYTHDYNGLSGGCGGDTGAALVTFTATDSCGNTAQSTAIVSVVDLLPPVWTSDPQDLVLNCNTTTDLAAEINAWLALAGNGLAADQCTGVSISNDYTGAIPGCTPATAVAVTFTAADDCTNSTSRTAQITILDADPPQIDVPATGVVVDCENPVISFADWLATHGGAEASDDCVSIDNSVGSPDWRAEPLALIPSCGNSFSQAARFIVMDACGNADTTIATYVVTDNSPPVFVTAPMAATANCNDATAQTVLNDWIDVFADAVVSDACGTASFVDFDFQTSEGEMGNNIAFGTTGDYPQLLADICDWSVVVTFRAQDACGLQNEASATFSIFDNTPPTISGVPADLIVDCQNIPAPASPLVNDDCDPNVGLSFSADTSLGTCPVLLVITRTWTATDACNNSSTATQVIRVEDNDDPILLGVPADTAVTCAGVPAPANVTVDDACDPNPTLSFSETDTRPNDGSCADYNYTITRVWTATDGCGRSVSQSQQLVVTDTEAPTFVGPPDVTLLCGQATDPTMTGQLTNVVDDCDPAPAVAFNDVISGGNCANTFVITRVWTVQDACGNTAVDYEQRITVTDEVAPQITNPAQDASGPCTDPMAAEVAFENWLLNRGGALATDNCTATTDLIWFAAVPGSYDPADLSTFPGTAPGTLDTSACPTPVLGLLRSETIDFVVYDECGNVALTSATFSVRDDTPPVFDNCPMDQTIVATAGNCEVDFDLLPPSITENCVRTGLVVEFSLNGTNRIAWDPLNTITVPLSTGANELTYFATDCAGNTTTCTYTVTIEDQEAPEISCPSDTIVYLTATDNCNMGKMVMLPLVAEMEDNCGFPLFQQVQPFDLADALLTFAYRADYDTYLAERKDFTFVATAANAAGSTVTFTVTAQGDVDDPEEYFLIYGEDGSLLGSTEVGQPNVTFAAGNCLANPVELAEVEARITVATSLYNAWAADGMVQVSAVANSSFSNPPPGVPDDGINPVCTAFAPGTPDGQNDGRSNLRIALEVLSANPYYYTTGATNLPNTPMLAPVIAPTVQFTLGDSEVFYVVPDLSGNEDTCSFRVSLVDTIAPQVSCLATTIFVNPSGTQSYTLEPSEIDNNSLDNCAIVDYRVAPNTFDCTQAGSFVDVTLYATDASGNVDSCTAIVAVETEGPSPSYSIGLCGNDTLSLFANPPAAMGGVVYTYSWTGPNGFSSTLENPILPGVDANDSGTYRVEVRGLTACGAAGTVEVLITSTPNTPIITANSNQLCTTDDLILSTQQYSGNVSYRWHAGIFPGGTFMAATTVPTFTLPAPLAAVTNTYFVIVEVDGCVSDASGFVAVAVTDIPTAATNAAQIDLCEGEEFSLGTPTVGAGLTYTWSGPNGFTSGQANPPAFVDPTLLQAGTYTLVVSQNGCPSLPVTTLVNIRPRPVQPSIASPGLICAGDSVVFITNASGADQYIWTAPNFSTFTTLTNTLTLPAATVADAGAWRVSTTLNGCDSPPSDPVELFVEPELVVVAINDGPVCAGASVQLGANTIAGADYRWEGPAGFSAVVQNPSTVAVPGTYAVTVTAVSGCSSSTSTDVIVNAVPEITAVTNSGTPCVTGAADITLAVELNPADPGNYTYTWTGPNGFSSVAAQAIVPNATSADNGNYQVVVTNIAGCTSLAMETTVNVSDVPSTPQITGPTVLCAGEALLLTAPIYAGSNVSYQWQTPNGSQTTMVPSLNLATSTVADSGRYQVSVLVDGCASSLSPEFVVDVNAIPAPPIATGPATVCAGESIALQTDLISGAIYQWTGPAGFAATVSNPVIPNATEANEGAYSVQVTIAGCTSAFSLPLNVVVNDNATAPNVLNNGPICIDDPDATLSLAIAVGTEIPGATYTWYDARTDLPVAPTTSDLLVILTDFSTYGEGSFDFYVIAEVSGCVAPASGMTTVVMNAIPNEVAFAGTNQALCNTTVATLAAQAPSLGTGRWRQSVGPPANIVNPEVPNAVVDGLQSGESYTFVWTLSNGACTDYSADEVSIVINSANEVAEAGLNQALCNVAEADLAAQLPQGGTTGTWTQSATQAAAGVIIVAPNAPDSRLTGLRSGETYTFTWTLSNPGCGDFASDQVNISIEENEIVAFAGPDFAGCSADGIIVLNATAPGNGTGRWTTDAPNLNIIEPTNPRTEVEGLVDAGEYTFTWTVSSAACGSSSDAVVLTFEAGPEAVDDLIEIDFAASVTFEVTDNDISTAPFTVELLAGPDAGQLTQTVAGEFIYVADPNFVGSVRFPYELCSEACPDVCSQATVEILVGQEVDCNVPTIFTPNDDLVNDFFIIPCLATGDFPQNALSIYNQWGDEVFQAAPYQNDWRGTYKGEELPVGTYYYVISFGPGESPQSGFLVLER